VLAVASPVHASSISLQYPTRSGLGAFIYRPFVAIVELMIVRGKPSRGLEAEVIALRHQVAVLQRTSNRPELTEVDRGVIRARPCDPPAGPSRIHEMS